MCGIAGYFNFSADKNIEHSLLQRMNNKQAHRGPNDEGYFLGKGVGLAHRRLSVIDLEGGHQPLFNDDKSVCVVFNGEIYNHLDLTKKLTKKGYTFNTASDTEVLVNAWQEWGVESVKYLQGMFAFCIWDENKKELFIARDRLGIKPLHYSLLQDGSFIFGSELKVLREHPSCSKELSNEAIEDYLTFGYVPDPKTILSNVFKLESGHYIHLKQNVLESEIMPIQYWDLPWKQDTGCSSLPKQENQLIERLKNSVQAHLVSDVPLGAFLSGGVDSGAIVALTSQLKTEPVTTCSIGFDVPKYNESDFAQLVADRYQTNHKLEIANSEDFDLIDRLTDIYDEPYADSSALPTYRVCELARKHVTVALSGDGGDELFAGYRRYKMHMSEQSVRDKLPLWLRKPIFGILGQIYPKLDWAPQWLRAKTTFQSLAMTSAHAYLNSMSKLREEQRFSLYTDTFKNRLNGYKSHQVFDNVLEGKVFDDKLKEVQYLDFKTWVPGDIHTKVDRASMQNSLEVRVPIFDHKFVEWAFCLPSNINLVKGEGKAEFKKQLEPHVPYDNLYRKKMGFSIPLAEWLRDPLKQKMLDLLTSKSFEKLEVFKPGKIKLLISEHLSHKSDHSVALWTLMMLGQFIQRELTE